MFWYSLHQKIKFRLIYSLKKQHRYKKWRWLNILTSTFVKTGWNYLGNAKWIYFVMTTKTSSHQGWGVRDVFNRFSSMFLPRFFVIIGTLWCKPTITQFAPLKNPKLMIPSSLPGFMTSLSLLFNLGIFKFYVRKQLTRDDGIRYGTSDNGLWISNLAS